MSDETLYLPREIINNRTCRAIADFRGKVLPLAVGIYACSGHGKGLAEMGTIEEWRKQTKGIVLVIADPKNEAEFSFVQHLPKARYHTEQLRHDGILPKTYSCKIYHPYTHNIPKGYLPDINFFTIPINTLTREDWTILAETPYDSESIRLLMRISSDLTRNDGLFRFLHNVQKIVQGKKDRKKAIPDPKNFYLSVGGGTAKSITEIVGLLHPFKQNYFLRKENCLYALDWSKILADNQNYHVFLSMWLNDDKLQEFMVLNLLKQIINNRHYTKKPILIVIPEIMKLCPRNPQGYKFFLSTAISEALVTIRSMGRGMSCIYDSQNYSNTDDKIKGSTNVTLFGQLSPKDLEVVCKSLNYKKEVREKLRKMDKNSFFRYGEEEYDPDRYFFPSHAIKEPEDNWIEMYEKNPELSKSMKRYDELVKFMRNEYDLEEKEIKENVEREIELQEAEEEQKRLEREERKKVKEEPKKEKEEKDNSLIKKVCYEKHEQGLSFRKIGAELSIHHLTAKKYYEAYKKSLETPIDLNEVKGEGIIKEDFVDAFIENEKVDNSNQ